MIRYVLVCDSEGCAMEKDKVNTKEGRHVIAEGDLYKLVKHVLALKNKIESGTPADEMNEVGFIYNLISKPQTWGCTREEFSKVGELIRRKAEEYQRRRHSFGQPPSSLSQIRDDSFGKAPLDNLVKAVTRMNAHTTLLPEHRHFDFTCPVANNLLLVNVTNKKDNDARFPNKSGDVRNHVRKNWRITVYSPTPLLQTDDYLLPLIADGFTAWGCLMKRGVLRGTYNGVECFNVSTPEDFKAAALLKMNAPVEGDDGQEYRARRLIPNGTLGKRKRSLEGVDDEKKESVREAIPVCGTSLNSGTLPVAAMDTELERWLLRKSVDVSPGVPLPGASAINRYRGDNPSYLGMYPYNTGVGGNADFTNLSGWMGRGGGMPGVNGPLYNAPTLQPYTTLHNVPVNNRGSYWSPAPNRSSFVNDVTDRTLVSTSVKGEEAAKVDGGAPTSDDESSYLGSAWQCYSYNK